MHFLIAYLLPEPARTHHVALGIELAKQYRLTPPSERIEPHCTIKAPFEVEDAEALLSIETALAGFTTKESAEPLTIGGFDTFHGRVVYESVTAPKQTHMLIRRLQDQLRSVPWLTWKRTEFPLTLHATLAYPKHPQQATQILKHLSATEVQTFTAMLDNLTLLEKVNGKWVVRKRYELKE